MELGANVHMYLRRILDLVFEDPRWSWAKKHDVAVKIRGGILGIAREKVDTFLDELMEETGDPFSQKAFDIAWEQIQSALTHSASKKD